MKYPLILSLHGAGQIGSDLNALLAVGLPQAIQKLPHAFPTIVIFPQSQGGNWDPTRQDGVRAWECLQDALGHYRVDMDRLYLTGYSMGGEGTWSIAGKYPDLFAAILPICPGKCLELVEQLRDIPCWCFQGGKDDLALVQNTRAMMLALQRGGSKVIYHEYPDLAHNCWDATYQNPETIAWLLEQKRQPK